MLEGIISGFAVAFTMQNLLFALLGCVLGTAVGVLPGLGPAATISLLLPVVYGFTDPATSIIFLAGIYYGAMYGGSTTSILLNIPGEAASVVTAIDGHEMAKKGRAGAALSVAAIGSFIAGTVGVIGLTFLAPPLSAIALKFGPPEYFSLMLLGLLLAVFLTGGSPLKGSIMLLCGVFLANVGIDPITGAERFTFGQIWLQDGFDFVTIAMGMFGISEILLTLEEKGGGTFVTDKIGRLFLTMQEWKDSRMAIVRGSLIGFFAGIIPGGGAVVASLASYSVEKKFSKHPEEFGHGSIAAVAGPESANNGASSSSFIPLLTLGIPCNASVAMIFAALMVQGITPGPFLITDHPTVFWGVIASMYIGNIMLLVLNLPMVGIWVKLLKVPFTILGPIIILFTVIGAYSLNNDVTNVFIMMFFGVVGYILRKLKFETSPLLMAFILTPLIENAMRQSLLMSKGSFLIFMNRPISGTMMSIFVLVIVYSFFSSFLKKRKARLNKQI